jgi:RNA polymerase-binding protein DksA
MATELKPQELNEFRDVLEDLRARLRGDVRQMTDEALRGNGPDGNGNLSNLPLHMADVGTENFDQEFTLGLIENEEETLELIAAAIRRIDAGTYGVCQDCGQPIARPRLQALPYTPYCIECARKRERG